MDKFFIRIFMALNTFIIRISRGRLGSRLANQTILLLHSRGRRSGKQHVTPISYFQVDGFYFLVGSNWGKDQNAGWYYNLLAQPRTTIEVKGQQDCRRGAARLKVRNTTGCGNMPSNGIRPISATSRGRNVISRLWF